MKPTNIVEGKVYKVLDIGFGEHGTKSVGAVVDGKYTSFYDIKEDLSYFHEGQKPQQIDLNEALNWNSDREEKLIEHLDAMLKAEDDDLIGMAIDIAEIDEDEPFALNLLDKKKEYKLHKQRVLGMIDAVEEVKAFLEGYYDKGGEIKRIAELGGIDVSKLLNTVDTARLIEENKRLHRRVETLSIIASFEVPDGKDREYYRNIALNAILGARKALEDDSDA